YQGAGRGLGSEAVLTLHRVLCGNLQPDLTILMDSEVSESVNRARRRNQQQKGSASQGDENRFETESRAFFTRVHDKYLEIAAREPHRVALIDARPPADVTHTKIVRAVRDRLLEPALR
ncbi:MAG TPA: dTMP kinase, partial [Terriglobales bacterium]